MRTVLVLCLLVTAGCNSRKSRELLYADGSPVRYGDRVRVVRGFYTGLEGVVFNRWCFLTDVTFGPSNINTDVACGDMEPIK